jgi:hypothetical protein
VHHRPAREFLVYVGLWSSGRCWFGILFCSGKISLLRLCSALVFLSSDLLPTHPWYFPRITGGVVRSILLSCVWLKILCVCCSWACVCYVSDLSSWKPVLFLSHRIKGSSFPNSRSASVVDSWSRTEGVRWNVCEVVRSQLSDFQCPGLACGFCLHRVVLPLWFQVPNSVLRANSFSIATRSWLS